MGKIRVLLVDDHTLFRQSLAYLLLQNPDVELVGQAGDGIEAVEKTRDLMPDLVLMDIRMPRRSGVEATRIIRQEMPGVNILILTVSDAEADLFEAIKAGAKGYMLKNVDSNDLVEAVRLVAVGGAVISSPMAESLLNEFGSMAERQAQRSRAPRTNLTDREREILSQLAHGASNREIGGALGISENTVRAHLRNILEKLHLHNRIQAAAYAIREGLVAETSPREATELAGEES
ncbi:MAG: response regulator transcription factor [Chloroflexi bacterium]|nr:response regulator transcription factor [Chloroflexota bacterium]MCL5109744.1 response regulator transcription factor [Chloroflexota bacterium]